MSELESIYMRQSEIASRTGINPGTVLNHIHRTKCPMHWVGGARMVYREHGEALISNIKAYYAHKAHQNQLNIVRAPEAA